jgi:hypothetical protein
MDLTNHNDQIWTHAYCEGRLDERRHADRPHSVRERLAIAWRLLTTGRVRRR